MSAKNPKIDAFLGRAKKWGEELTALRKISLASGLTEELKWGKPCYSFQGGNVVILQGFKDTCALLFAKGALLKDPRKLLEKPGEHTQAARRIPFTSVEQIVKLTPTLKDYLKEAIAVEESGVEVEYKKITEYPVLEELQQKLDESPPFRHAFESLTPGRQRGYYMFFAAPKQTQTRLARIEKCRAQILQGRGLNDDYKSGKK